MRAHIAWFVCTLTLPAFSCSFSSHLGITSTHLKNSGGTAEIASCSCPSCSSNVVGFIEYAPSFHQPQGKDHMVLNQGF